MPVVNKGLLIRAILFTLILSIGPIAEMARFSGNSYRTLNDIDEGFYLGVTMQAGRVPLSALVTDGLFDSKDSILVMPAIPQLVSDHFLRALARTANINGAELGLAAGLVIGGGKIPLRSAADIFGAVPEYVSEYAELSAKLRSFENKDASIVYMVYQAPFQELPELELHEIPLASLQAIAP